MDYKKKYEEALERAGEVLGCGPVTKGSIKYIFPELAENKNEKIKESIKKVLANTDFKKLGIEYSFYDMINWLEADKEKKDLKYVDPEFKLGDWICNNLYSLHITAINDGKYYFNSGDSYSYGDIKFINNNYHLWTIKDAKPGDVLACCDNKPFIFKGFFDLNFPNCLAAYCGVTLENQFVHCNGKTFWTNQDVKPATKEQCNLLFQKMHEAGYEWDAEKNELKKIEFNPDDLIEESYQQQADDLINMVTEKSTWSKEDEENYRNATTIISRQRINTYNVEMMSYCNRCIDWLKSIRQRLQ